MSEFFDIAPHSPLINNPDVLYPREVFLPTADHTESESTFKTSVLSVIVGIMTANYPNLTSNQRIWAAETMKATNAYTVDIKPLTGGISNVLYLVHRIDSSTSSIDSIILRIYGAGTSKIIDRSIENIVFAKLSSESSFCEVRERVESRLNSTRSLWRDPRYSSLFFPGTTSHVCPGLPNKPLRPRTR